MRLIIAEKEHVQAAAELTSKLWPGHTEEEMQECVLEYMEDAEKTILLAKEEGVFCGICFASLRHDYVEGTEGSPVGYLEGIYVQASFRKKGIALALLKAAERWAKEMGCTEFASDCELDNTGSLAFHLAIGFEEAGRTIWFNKKL